jgi:RING finger and CHY zinc finger domain-containing protein 1
MSDLTQEIYKINSMKIEKKEKTKLIFALLNPKKNKKKFKTPICTHYKKKYYLVAECCKKTYSCRFCHDEEENHLIERKETKYMKCTACLCNTLISNKSCQNKDCYHYLKKEKYFCEVCNVWFNDSTLNLVNINSILIDNISINKKCFHCSDCGICRVGQKKDYKHCQKCNLCINSITFEQHNCTSNVKECDCPICLKGIWDSNDNPHILKCGHSVHLKCFFEFIRQDNYQCPLCKKSIIDMTEYWKRIELFKETQPIPSDSEYIYWKSNIHCNDCEKKSQVDYHFFYHKCMNCNGYNTVIDNVLKKTS